MRTRCITVLLSALLCSTPAFAEIGDAETAARALDRQASTLFDAGEYEEALDRMESAQRILPNSVRIYNIAVCHERLGNFSGAIINYQRFVEQDDVPEARRLRALERIDRLESQLDIPDEPVFFDASFGLEAERGDRHRLSPSIFYSLLGVTIASGLGIIITGAVALSHQSDFERTVLGTADGDSIRDMGEPWVVACNVLIGITSVAAVATLIVGLFTRWGRDRESRHSRIRGVPSSSL